jgi:chemotaxis signal transduction protein
MADSANSLFQIPGIIVFDIADKEFCADIRQVYKIIKIPEESDLYDPKSGTVCINNVKLPVIDLYEYFEKGQKKNCNIQ